MLGKNELQTFSHIVPLYMLLPSKLQPQRQHIIIVSWSNLIGAETLISYGRFCMGCIRYWTTYNRLSVVCKDLMLKGICRLMKYHQHKLFFLQSISCFHFRLWCLWQLILYLWNWKWKIENCPSFCLNASYWHKYYI